MHCTKRLSENFTFCLSRACLGKVLILSIKWLKRGCLFLPGSPSRSQSSCKSAPLHTPSAPARTGRSNRPASPVMLIHSLARLVLCLARFQASGFFWCRKEKGKKREGKGRNERNKSGVVSGGHASFDCSCAVKSRETISSGQIAKRISSYISTKNQKQRKCRRFVVPIALCVFFVPSLSGACLGKRRCLFQRWELNGKACFAPGLRRGQAHRRRQTHSRSPLGCSLPQQLAHSRLSTMTCKIDSKQSQNSVAARLKSEQQANKPATQLARL